MTELMHEPQAASIHFQLNNQIKPVSRIIIKAN